ncbi:MAG: hypothetical protein R2795_13785 [Saprospiraceae bacterium]
MKIQYLSIEKTDSESPWSKKVDKTFKMKHLFRHFSLSCSESISFLSLRTYTLLVTLFIILALAIGGLSTPIWGQASSLHSIEALNIVTKVINDNEGIRHEPINNCIRDSIGFYWFCSDNGVYRYDGYEAHFISSAALGVNDTRFVIKIFNDQDNRLWLCPLFFHTETNRFVFSAPSMLKLLQPLTATFQASLASFRKINQSTQQDIFYPIQGGSHFFIVKNGSQLYQMVDGQLHFIDRFPDLPFIDEVYYSPITKTWYLLAGGKLYQYTRHNGLKRLFLMMLHKCYFVVLTAINY